MGLGPAAALSCWAAFLAAWSAGRFPLPTGPVPDRAGSPLGARAVDDRHVRSLLSCPWQWEGFFFVPNFLSSRRQSSPLSVNSACVQVAEAHLGSAWMSARSLRPPRRLHACPKLRPPCPAAPRQGLSPEDLGGRRCGAGFARPFPGEAAPVCEAHVPGPQGNVRQVRPA